MNNYSNTHLFITFSLLFFFNNIVNSESLYNLPEVTLGLPAARFQPQHQHPRHLQLLLNMLSVPRDIVLHIEQITENLLSDTIVTHIRVVRSHHNQTLTAIQVRILGQRFPNTRALTLINVGFNTAATQELIAYFPYLRILDLTHNPEFTSESETILRTAPWINNLSILRLNSSSFFGNLN